MWLSRDANRELVITQEPGASNPVVRGLKPKVSGYEDEILMEEVFPVLNLKLQWTPGNQPFSASRILKFVEVLMKLMEHPQSSVRGPESRSPPGR